MTGYVCYILYRIMFLFFFFRLIDGYLKLVSHLAYFSDYPGRPDLTLKVDSLS